MAEARNTIKEGAGVRVLGGAENFLDGTLFDQFSVEHDKDSVGEIGDDAKVVGDEENRHAKLFPKIAKEIKNLGLDGNIEGGGGFVGDEKFGLAGEGHGDHSALLHSARKLVGIIARAEFGIADTDEAEQAGDFGRSAGKKGLMEAKGFSDLESDREDGVEGGGGFLKDVGEFSSSGLAEGGVGAGEEIGAILPEDLTAEAAGGRGWSEAGEGEGGGGFARTTFSDDGDGFSGLDGEGEVLHGDN